MAEISGRAAGGSHWGYTETPYAVALGAPRGAVAAAVATRSAPHRPGERVSRTDREHHPIQLASADPSTAHDVPQDAVDLPTDLSRVEQLPA
jgi:hypothetical protein